MPTVNSGAKNAAMRTAIAMSQRTMNRFHLLRAGGLKATWLADGDVIDAEGTVGNISLGGFCATMANAPPRGRILHARLNLETAKGGAPKTIEADARVCGRTRFSDRTKNQPGWMVNFAIESIHPVDEKLIVRAIDAIKARGH
jgi:hypothetical protein